MAKISLTGIKPTGIPHLGNYLGSIKPSLEMSKDYLSLYFIADWHALTTIRDGKILRPLIHKLAATWLACGLDPKNVIFFRQSQIPEIAELNWYLSCFMAKGVLNRSHAYKAIADMNGFLRQDADSGVTMGLFNYPTLMAADILLFGSNVVPVGQDQRSHVEIAKDIAGSVNHHLGRVFNIPEPIIKDDASIITGTDGKKMSKSYNNVIPIFGTNKEIHKAVMSIVTDSQRPEDSKDPKTCNIFNIYKHFAKQDEIENMFARYKRGGVAYADVKQELEMAIAYHFKDAKKKYDEYMLRPELLDDILAEGAEKAREISSPRISKIRKLLGLS